MKDLENTLEFIANQLNDQKMKWLLGASGSLWVQGVDVKPHDLDFFLNKNDLLNLEKILAEYIEEPLNEFDRRGESVNKFKVKINNIDAEFYELNMDKETPILVKFKGVDIPVNRLEEELKFYTDRPGKEEVVEKIKLVISKTNNK